MMFAFFMPSPMQILFLLVGLIVLRSIVKKPCGRKLAKLLGFGLLMLALLMLSFSFTSYRTEVANRDTHAKNTSHKSQISTEKMWQHLNRSRIVLDAESKADTAKQDVPEEIDLTEAEEPEQTRPAWVDQPPKRIGHVYRVVVSAGPYKDETECYHALEPLLSKAVKQRIEQLVPGSQVPELEQLGLGVDYILRDLCDQAWVEIIESPSIGEMKQVHVQMQFGAAQDQQLRTAFRDYQRQARVAKVGGIAGLGLGGLALLYGLLKIVPGREAAT